MENLLTPFEGKHLRKIVSNGETYYAIVDIINILTESKDAANYWRVMKNREPQLITICNGFKMTSTDGKKRLTDCANTEGVFRIIQSVASPNAEPFKMWLAGLGKQAIDEFADPELLSERQAELYRAKGYSEEWIKNRLQSITTRKELTDEWKNRGVKEGQEFSILTATIAKGTFGLSPSEHAQHKGLAKENLRDHMTPLELILTAFGEEVTRQITIRDDAQGFTENHDVAERGGKLAGDARQMVEKRENVKIVSDSNFLNLQKVAAPENVDKPPTETTEPES